MAKDVHQALIDIVAEHGGMKESVTAVMEPFMSSLYEADAEGKFSVTAVMFIESAFSGLLAEGFD